MYKTKKKLENGKWKKSVFVKNKYLDTYILNLN